MKVILLKEVGGLGDIGDEVEVKDGYARNYLIPRKLVIASTKGALKILEQKRHQRERKEKQLKEEAERIAEKLANVSCTISMEAGEEEKLFGSVTSEMIAESLHGEGFEIDKKNVRLEEPIKSLGVYNVDVWLHSEVKAQIRIWVVKK